MCAEFCAPTFKLLLSHVSRVHSNTPSFSFTCGLQGCLTTFKSYVALKKHICRKHKCVSIEDNPEDPILDNPGDPSPSFLESFDEDLIEETDQPDECKLNSAR